MRVLALFAVITLFLWSLAGECTVFRSSLAVMCDRQDLTLQAILSNGVAIVRQTLGWGAKKRRKLALWPDFIS
jgi:hypothetical protein